MPSASVSGNSRKVGNYIFDSLTTRVPGNSARLVTLDLDPTDDPTRGTQQMSFFNGHYDNWCYLPVMGFVSFNAEAEQYLCAAVLRPGNVTAPVGAVGILRRLLKLGARVMVSVRRMALHLPASFPFLSAFRLGKPSSSCFISAQTAYAGKQRTQTAAAPREHKLKVARPAIPPTSISHEHLPGNLVNPKQQSQRLHE